MNMVQRQNQLIRQARVSPSLIYASTPACTAQLATMSAARTSELSSAFAQFRSDIIQRGVIYAANNTASRGGFMAEEFVAGSYNVDATIKGNSSRAFTDKSTASASADITYDNGKSASLKYYTDGKSSAKAQLNPEYGDQTRIVPSDQKEDAKIAIEEIAKRNEAKGRIDVAQQQRDVEDKIASKIIGDDGTESTELTKKQDMDMADAIGKDSNGNVIVDEDKIDSVIKETGITDRVKKAKLINELKGLGLATVIGIGVGFTFGLIAEMARVGVDSTQMSDVVFNSLGAGLESGMISGVTYLTGRGASALLEKVGVNLATNVGKCISMGALGLLSTALICTYQYVKLRISGANSEEAFRVVGKTAASSLTVLTVSIIAQGIWGGYAGIIVSTGIGIMYFTYGICKSTHDRKLEEHIREFSIEDYKCAIEENNLIYI